MKTKVINEIKIPNFIFIFLEPIEHNSNICFGEYKYKDKFVTGFFRVNFLKKNVELIKELDTNSKSKILVNSLKYSGKFSNVKDNKIISFTCEKFSKIYFFKSDGTYLKELETLDKTPLPKVITDDNGYNFYSRKGTWNTNMSTFMYKDKIFVFSATDKNINSMTIDVYSFLDLKYQKSFKFNYENNSSFDVRNVYLIKNKLTIVFEFYYASFIVSSNI